jgi:tRNA threonylcarbamoyl adenosine modification protein (Sua5/YciO/YrdC/YwlC family)
MLIRGILGITRSIAKKSISSKTITEVSAAIHAGRLVVLPATSGYIIACDAQNASAITDLNLLRENSEEYILSMIFSSISQMDGEVTIPSFSQEIKEYIQTGQLTLVLPRDESMRVNANGFKELVAVNIPINQNVKKLLEISGPCVVAAAAIPGLGLPLTTKDISLKIKDGVEYILDAGKISGIVSTIINFEKRKPILSRIGAVPAEIVKRLFPEI